MSSEFEEHLLSAYLDNELSSDERALVDQRLQTDESAREQLEDLKRVRGLVATLPGWTGSIAPFDASNLVSEEDPHGHSAGKVNLLEERDHASTSGTRWKTLLAMAAGLIVMLLSGPWFWRTLQSPMAMDRSNGGGGGYSTNSPAISSQTSNEELGTTDAMKPGASREGVRDEAEPKNEAEAKVEAKNKALPPAAPAPAVPSLARIDSPASSEKNAASPKENAEVAGSAGLGSAGIGGASMAGGMANGMSNGPASGAMGARGRGTSEQESLGLNTNFSNNLAATSNSLVLGYSNAWSVEEIQQSLPAILPYTPAASATGIAPVTDNAVAADDHRLKRDATAQSVTDAKKTESTDRSQSQAAIASGLAINQYATAPLSVAQLPDTDTPEQWFESIRSVGQLNQLPVAAPVNAASNVNAGTGPARSNAANDPTAAAATPRANSVADARTMKRSAADQPTDKDNATVANNPTDADQPTDATKQTQRSESRNGSIVLFVTESEADQIMQRIESLEVTQRSQSQRQQMRRQQGAPAAPQIQQPMAAPAAAQPQSGSNVSNADQVQLRMADPSQAGIRQDSLKVWRVNPQQPARRAGDSQTGEARPNDKVILILNQAP